MVVATIKKNSHRKFNNQIMNNDLPPSWKFEEVVTINCEFHLFGLEEAAILHCKKKIVIVTNLSLGRTVNVKFLCSANENL